MLVTPDGSLMAARALARFDAHPDARVLIGILREHDERYQAVAGLRRALKREVEIVILDQPTPGPAETVRQMLLQADVSGPIFVQDCDSWYTPPARLDRNQVCVVDLRRNLEVTQVAAKSFVTRGEDGAITAIVEKEVASNFISVGGYGFADATVFLKACARLQRAGFSGEPFLSHVVRESMRGGEAFVAQEVEDYVDVGTLEAWNTYRARQSTYVVDLDGVVFWNRGEFFGPLWTEPDAILPQNVEALRSLQRQGAQLVLMTARSPSVREKTEAALRDAGLDWHALIMGCHHGRRFLVNDYAPTNPYPAAVAVNVPRDQDILNQLLPRPGLGAPDGA